MPCIASQSSRATTPSSQPVKSHLAVDLARVQALGQQLPLQKRSNQMRRDLNRSTPTLVEAASAEVVCPLGGQWPLSSLGQTESPSNQSLMSPRSPSLALLPG